MSDPATAHLALAALYALPALVWAILAWDYRVLFRDHPPRARAFQLFPALFGLVAAFYLVQVAVQLLLPELEGRLAQRVLLLVAALLLVALGPVLRHFIVAVPALFLGDEQPGRGWLARNYGSAVGAGVLVLLPSLVGVPGRDPLLVSGSLATLYLVCMGALAFPQRGVTVRGGPFRVGVLRGQIHWADVAVFGAVGALLVAITVAGLRGAAEGVGHHLLVAGIGLAVAAVFAVRDLALILRSVLLAGGALVTAATVHVGARAMGAGLESAVLRRLVDVGAVLALALLLVPGATWLQHAVDGLLGRHGRRAREALESFLDTLSPETGVLDCCRRALAEVVRVLGLRGGAILLGRDGDAVVRGEFSIEPLRRVWPEGEAAETLPRREIAFHWPWLADARLRTALAEADVAAVVPIASPRRRWGDLFITADLIGWPKREEPVRTLEAFADRLALVLDASDLLARAVAVERSLAHAEKLAAVGELAARIVHEIRNPVTAARSLAQQLAREPGSPSGEEHALILAELERVERQVTALLRFARREEFDLGPVDLGELARATVASFGPRLEAVGVDVRLEAEMGVVARADREKIRQVLVNLLENALDVLSDGDGPKRVTLVVGGTDGTATVRVTDNGPGVPPDALPHLFEPFFSRKASGTGLGLAIARRTVEAHHGRIDATSPPGGGTTFSITLPMAGEAR